MRKIIFLFIILIFTLAACNAGHNEDGSVIGQTDMHADHNDHSEDEHMLDNEHMEMHEEHMEEHMDEMEHVDDHMDHMQDMMGEHMANMHDSHSHGELEAVVNLGINPEMPLAGERAEINFNILDHHLEPLNNLMTHHGRKVHVVIIDSDFETIGHIHPSDFENTIDEVAGNYKVYYEFPKPGRYILALDIMNMDGVYSETFLVDVDGVDRMPFQMDFSSNELQVVGVTEEKLDTYTKPVYVQNQMSDEGYSIKFNHGNIIAGQESLMIFDLDFSANMYLDAPMHFAIVKKDLSKFYHSHGEFTNAEYNQVKLTHTFETSGEYTLFGQVKKDNEIIITRFDFNVVDEQ